MHPIFFDRVANVTHFYECSWSLVFQPTHCGTKSSIRPQLFLGSGVHAHLFDFGCLPCSQRQSLRGEAVVGRNENVWQTVWWRKCKSFTQNLCFLKSWTCVKWQKMWQSANANGRLQPKMFAWSFRLQSSMEASGSGGAFMEHSASHLAAFWMCLAASALLWFISNVLSALSICASDLVTRHAVTISNSSVADWLFSVAGRKRWKRGDCQLMSDYLWCCGNCNYILYFVK